jgi:hypothetical protein
MKDSFISSSMSRETILSRLFGAVMRLGYLKPSFRRSRNPNAFESLDPGCRRVTVVKDERGGADHAI